MCNRIWSFASIIAHAVLFKEKLLVFDFVEYIEDFPEINSVKYVHFVKSQMEQRFYYLFFRIFKKFGLLSNYISDSKTKKLAYIDGWDYRHDYINLDKVHNQIYQMFYPQIFVADFCIALFAKERKDTDLIIGFHLRRGDYKEWRNGFYYYEDEVILNYMSQILSIFKMKKVKFFIASNENINVDNFREYNCFKNLNNSSINDLFSLGLCDFIIGPPSSYSMWASFYGKKPLRIINTRNDKLLLSDFEIIRAEDIFMSGRKWEHPDQLNIKY